MDELHGRVAPARPPTAAGKKGGPGPAAAEPADAAAEDDEGGRRRGRRRMGRNWVHAAVAAASRFLIDVRLGPRTLGTAAAMVATVAACCLGALPLLLVDGHLPCSAAIPQVFGVVKHGRRKRGRGRPKRDRLKPPGAAGRRGQQDGERGWPRVPRPRHALFGRLRDVCQRVRELGVGTDVNTSRVERLNGTCRGCVARLARRTRDVSCRRTRRCGRRCRCPGTPTNGAAPTAPSRPAWRRPWTLGSRPRLGRRRATSSTRPTTTRWHSCCGTRDWERC